MLLETNDVAFANDIIDIQSTTQIHEKRLDHLDDQMKENIKNIDFLVQDIQLVEHHYDCVNNEIINNRMRILTCHDMVEELQATVAAQTNLIVLLKNILITCLGLSGTGLALVVWHLLKLGAM